ncbi:DUF6418 domain-containing protein [Aquimarina sp. 2201CG5-10]|uniref:DUF6418 domain-containing protein n=1 Tax=Aquimarina callyspongiae TaxID=3098150 RepID=UPI002AB4A2B3|nr:DUF6418 domain-containing protein [Aquimarina sp. 2201CG5-10]MDY8138682.1 DUF6418 domain-containing protein [Aquimarina sp. 2201CG5-10]
MTLVFNLILLGIFFFFLYMFAKKNFKVLFIYGLLVFQGLSIIPSLIYIEEGIYISEQGRDSFFVGATLIYIVYFIITFLFILATFNTLKKVKPITPRLKIGNTILDVKVIFFIVIATLLVLLYNASQSRLPLFDIGVTRFTYWENSKFPFLNKVLGNTSIFIPFALGILFKRYKKSSIFLMMVYFGYNFLIGQKFSPIVSGLFSFFLPIVLTSDYKIDFKKIFNKKVLFPLIIIFGVAYAVIYKRYEERSPYAIIKIYDPNEAIFYRAFGLQGHLMWGAAETYVYNDEAHSYNFMDLSKGMQKLMYKFAAVKTGLDKAINKGFNFTNGYPSILLMVYPIWIALIIHVFLTVSILGFLGWLLKEFITKKAYVMSVITYQLFNWTIYAFTMGYFYKLKYTIIFLICYSIFVFMNQRTREKLRINQQENN